MIISQSMLRITITTAMACGLSLLTACESTQSNNISIDNNQPSQPPMQSINHNRPLSEQLFNHNWQLHNAVDKSGSAITALTSIKEQVKLNFHQDTARANSIGFSVGCNGYGADYQLDNNGQLTTDHIIGTEMYCEQLDDAERKLVRLMSVDSQLSIENHNLPMLTQVTEEGAVLTWQGVLTDTAKYGEGETIFLEVAPDVQACSSGINQQCLKVRDVFYNDTGIKSGYGEWRVMKSPIEGYTHDASTRQILRIKKYITDPVDVKGKQLVYVLNMAVETELVK